ncbi:hypothetical protein [Sphingosinicella soli]|uniref:Uncharacterized protein n=1 Tax=Sphingosinicella soli TaxID=333708 RepID=A0A7W7F795_9SPHN|nr:hypothetical protein [Sphingosinicella soli]MBB4632449.1 hypothetical protein [Sphingosinicella soli]
MKDQTIFYEERIAEARQAVSVAALDNVRHQAELALDRWIELSDQHVRTREARMKVIADKSARDAERDEERTSAMDAVPDEDAA